MSQTRRLSAILAADGQRVLTARGTEGSNLVCSSNESEAGDAAFPERGETFPKKGETAEIWRCIDTLSCAA
jgi:hypothetical protein